ncbi:NAD(P)/FAD-dependent oxidoreductase [Myroides odoratimimus subsp. xuanwuensis]
MAGAGHLGRMDVDVVVIGLGPGGELAANKLARAGLSVVGVERRLVGGECPYFGCIPSEMIIRAADSLAEARRADGLGGDVEITPDWDQVAARIDKQATAGWTDDSHVQRLEEAGVTIVRGQGRLDGPGRVVVETEDGPREYVAARGVVINPGRDPGVPDIAGLADTPYWTNRDVAQTQDLPESMVILGAGAMGCEFAQAFARFGVKITLLETGPRLVPSEEPEVCELLAGVLSGEGVEIVTEAEVSSVSRDDGRFRICVDDRVVEADQLLLSWGRRANLTGMGLETVGLDPDADVVETDERMRAGEGLWAVGDVTGKGDYTHVSLYQGDVVVRDVLGEGGPWADYRSVGRVTFTDPEIGSLGLTEELAREAGIRVITGSADMPRSSRGWIHQAGNEGLIKLVADADRQVLVGGTAMGPAGGEVLGMLAAAVHAEIPLDTLRTMHFAYPTFHRAVEAALGDLGRD